MMVNTATLIEVGLQDVIWITTLFEALTKIVTDDMAPKHEDRLGTIKVPDERVEQLSRMYNPKKTVFAQVEYLLPHMLKSHQLP